MTDIEIRLTLRMRYVASKSINDIDRFFTRAIRSIKYNNCIPVLFFETHNCPRDYCSNTCSRCWELCIKEFVEKGDRPRL